MIESDGRINSGDFMWLSLELTAIKLSQIAYILNIFQSGHIREHLFSKLKWFLRFYLFLNTSLIKLTNDLVNLFFTHKLCFAYLDAWGLKLYSCITPFTHVTFVHQYMNIVLPPSLSVFFLFNEHLVNGSTYMCISVMLLGEWYFRFSTYISWTKHLVFGL